ncbi:hypothetical protein [Maridesulfovibrio sp.]|uniref:hypothetical protein n=1 Tax=Maridesulfovibrio sp. TaxID=2795000 RepID=UPI0039F11CEF
MNNKRTLKASILFKIIMLFYRLFWRYKTKQIKKANEIVYYYCVKYYFFNDAVNDMHVLKLSYITASIGLDMPVSWEYCDFIQENVDTIHNALESLYDEDCFYMVNRSKFVVFNYGTFDGKVEPDDTFDKSIVNAKEYGAAYKYILKNYKEKKIGFKEILNELRRKNVVKIRTEYSTSDLVHFITFFSVCLLTSCYLYGTFLLDNFGVDGGAYFDVQDYLSMFAWKILKSIILPLLIIFTMRFFLDKDDPGINFSEFESRIKKYNRYAIFTWFVFGILITDVFISGDYYSSNLLLLNTVVAICASRWLSVHFEDRGKASKAIFISVLFFLNVLVLSYWDYDSLLENGESLSNSTSYVFDGQHDSSQPFVLVAANSKFFILFDSEKQKISIVPTRTVTEIQHNKKLHESYFKVFFSFISTNLKNIKSSLTEWLHFDAKTEFPIKISSTQLDNSTTKHTTV